VQSRLSMFDLGQKQTSHSALGPALSLTVRRQRDHYNHRLLAVVGAVHVVDREGAH